VRTPAGVRRENQMLVGYLDRGARARVIPDTAAVP
jgi:hypothetical protein